MRSCTPRLLLPCSCSPLAIPLPPIWGCTIFLKILYTPFGAILHLSTVFALLLFSPSYTPPFGVYNILKNIVHPIWCDSAPLDRCCPALAPCPKPFGVYNIFKNIVHPIWCDSAPPRLRTLLGNLRKFVSALMPPHPLPFTIMLHSPFLWPM